ncbi:MAG: hypothetical protein P4M04_05330 [Acidobacteriota bacterium]|nr:hypothetical protein [Acidobacteriota bacterium]
MTISGTGAIAGSPGDTVKTTNGDRHIVGVDFWSLTDSGWGEATNWGLISDRDSAYNGKQTVAAPGKDSWGFPICGEDKSYWNYIDQATQTNVNIIRQFIVDKLP